MSTSHIIAFAIASALLDSGWTFFAGSVRRRIALGGGLAVETARA